MHAFELVFVAAQCPFVGAEFVVGEDFHSVGVGHVGDELAEQVGGTVVVGVAGHDDVADAGGLASGGEVAGELQGRFALNQA